MTEIRISERCRRDNGSGLTLFTAAGGMLSKMFLKLPHIEDGVHPERMHHRDRGTPPAWAWAARRPADAGSRRPIADISSTQRYQHGSTFEFQQRGSEGWPSPAGPVISAS